MPERRLSYRGLARLAARPGPVTAPVEALPTRRAYLASTPVVAKGLRGFHPAQRGRGQIRPDLPPHRIDRNDVSVAQKANGPAHRRLRRNMSHHEPVATAGEAPIGDQRDLVRQAAADDCARGTQHLAHARTADRTFVADDDDIACTHTPGKDGRGRLLL